jgi:preprotein translocase subunit SecF
MEILKNPNYDFLGKAKYFIPASLAVIAAGFFMIGTRGLRSGVEFSGGTQIIAKFKETPAIDRIRDAVEKGSPGSVIQSYGEATRNQVLVRLAAPPENAPAEGELDTSARKALDALAANYPQNPVLEHSAEIVGPVVGADLRQRAIWLTVFGLLFQLVYITVRFGGGIWGAAAVIACLHDVLFCLAFLCFFGYEITLNVVAALLTLVGYSVNDTIVIFDRARENLRQRRKEPIGRVLNDSVNQTLTRTLISNGTTFLAVLGLYLFGGEVLAGFGFTMVVGIVVGTYSTIYIAGPIVAWWSERKGSVGQGKAALGTAKAAL